MDRRIDVKVETVPLSFYCGPDQLVGLLHLPARPKSCGVVIVAGAPQYRVGSHRQFVLLARDLAAAGFPVLRFDYRGTGDSDGEFAGFESIDGDIGSAIDAFFERAPCLREVALWGLCDGASAIAFYARTDPRVSAMILVNPWVRDDMTLARARIQHYYARHILSSAFWRRLFTGKVNVTRSLRIAISTLFALFRDRMKTSSSQDVTNNAASLSSRVAAGLEQFSGRILIVLSGADMTAQEFNANVLNRKTPIHPLATVHHLAEANHTYSTGVWRELVHDWTIEWLQASQDHSHSGNSREL